MGSTYFFDLFGIQLACEVCCEIPPSLYTNSIGIIICGNCGTVASWPPAERTENNSNAGNILPSNSLGGDALYENNRMLPNVEATLEVVSENATGTLSQQPFHCTNSSNELHEGNMNNNIQQQTTLLSSPNGQSDNLRSGTNMPLGAEMDIPPIGQSQNEELRTEQLSSGRSSCFVFNSDLAQELLQVVQQRISQRVGLHNVQVLGNAHAVEVEIAQIHASMGLLSDIKILALEIAQFVPASYHFRHEKFRVAMAACLFLSCKALRKHLMPLKEFTNPLRCDRLSFYGVFRSIERAILKAERSTHQDEFVTALARLLWPKYEDEERVLTEEEEALYLCELCCQRLMLDEPYTRICKELVTKLIREPSYCAFRWYTKAAVSVMIVAHLMGNPKNRFDVSAAASIGWTTLNLLARNVYSSRDSLFEPSWLSAGADIAKWPAWRM